MVQSISTYIRVWGRNMEFEHVVQLARDTPTSALCEALGVSAREVKSLKRGERPMTIREAGALADLHGMQLLDVLAV
ncbi:helix-turn-helix DNA binding protein [Arthrobacter phage Maja]|uniref:Helix-turn-helix DNA binding protein n=1 Tax=Arthrobacter phage Maja TaxID=2499009 RepID=A0A3S9UN04_9CAUD|nr:helix-turn-helix DNA binding protein [Arthrobacter phage Maja]AZS11729.1 helix-turn-helix DNA-binding protein [Arthrobacter phage Maja]